jgi:hypothetical protein
MKFTRSLAILFVAMTRAQDGGGCMGETRI